MLPEAKKAQIVWISILFTFRRLFDEGQTVVVSTKKSLALASRSQS
jgi:hypothetical protein